MESGGASRCHQPPAFTSFQPTPFLGCAGTHREDESTGAESDTWPMAPRETALHPRVGVVLSVLAQGE